MIKLETDRLYLRGWAEDSDFRPLCEFYADTDASKYVGGTKDPEMVWRQIVSYLGHYQLRGYSYWAVEEKSSNALVGAVGLWNSPAWPELELGYFILPVMQGRGFATEAACRCQNYAFDTLQELTLASFIKKENIASRHVALKLGGQFDGMIDLANFGPHEVYRYKR
jgi:RimJ/RimL family protein N-acetyltransferase